MKGVKLLIKQKFVARKELVVHMTTDLSRFPLTEGASTSGQPQSIPWFNVYKINVVVWLIIKII